MDNQKIKELEQLSITLTNILTNLHKIQCNLPYDDKYKTGKTSISILDKNIIFDNNIINEMLFRQKQIDETAIMNLITELSENELMDYLLQKKL